MSMALVAFGRIVLLRIPVAVTLSVYIGVFGCGCPISVRVCWILTALRSLMYSALNSASTADDVTALNICASNNMAPLSGGIGLSLERGKCPPALLRAFFC